MKRLLLPLCAGLLHAFCMLLAFAPNEFWPATLVAILPLVWIAVRKPATRIDWRAAIAISLGASPFYWYQQQWVYEISIAGYVPLVLYMTIYPGLFSYCLSRLHTRYPRLALGLLVPIVWTGLEWLRGEIVWDGYAWFLLAHPLIDAPNLAWSATIVGAYGVGAFIAALAGFVFDIPNLRASPSGQSPRKLWKLALPGASVAALFIALTFAGRPPLPSNTPAQFRVGLVQTNLPQSNKIAWSPEQRKIDFARFLELTREAATQKPSLIVWPETMFPGILEPVEEPRPDGSIARLYTPFAGALLQVQHELNIPMLIGATGLENLRANPDDPQRHLKWDRHFNSVMLVKDADVQPLRYDKVRLTPFGETMPYISAWPWLQDKLLSIGAAGMSFDLATGTSDRIGAFEFPVTKPADGNKRPQIVRVVTPICFEITESSLCRKLVNQAAQARASVLIANVTNDGWFGSFDPARQQHQLASRWRSLELGVPVVRAANTGISSITEFGRSSKNQLLHSQNRISRVAGTMVENVSLFQQSTIFRQVGDLCWLFTLALGGFLILAFRRQTPNNSTG